MILNIVNELNSVIIPKLKELKSNLSELIPDEIIDIIISGLLQEHLGNVLGYTDSNTVKPNNVNSVHPDCLVHPDCIFDDMYGQEGKYISLSFKICIYKTLCGIYGYMPEDVLVEDNPKTRAIIKSLVDEAIKRGIEVIIDKPEDYSYNYVTASDIINSYGLEVATVEIDKYLINGLAICNKIDGNSSILYLKNRGLDKLMETFSNKFKSV